MSTPNSKDIQADINSCISTGLDFQSNSPGLLSFISTCSKSVADDFLKNIFNILDNSQASPTSKFYALLLLLKATEECKDIVPIRLAKQKFLLDKLFKEAQFDKHKDLTHRGQRFFVSKPSKEQAILGANYIRLVLESIVYWYKTFGTESTRSPLHLFNVMYNNLNTLLALPDAFYYAQRTLLVTNHWHLRHYLTLTDDPVSLKPLVINKNDSVKPKTTPNQSLKEKISSVLNYENFKKNITAILDEVGKNSWIYNKSLLRAIDEILNDHQSLFSQKFYSLLLLARLTETRNEAFLQHLSQDSGLLESLRKHITSKDIVENNNDSEVNPDSVSGERMYKEYFDTLLSESVTFWTNLCKCLQQEGFGDRFTHLKVFCDSVISQIEPVTVYRFVGKTIQDDIDQNIISKADSNGNIEKEPAEQEPSKHEPETEVSSERKNFESAYELAQTHHETCVASEEGYKGTIEIVYQILTEGTLNNYVEGLFNSISKVLLQAGKIEDRFCTVYFLLKATQTGNQELLNRLEVAKNLLAKLRDDALNGMKLVKLQGKVVNLTSKSPQEIEETLLVSGYTRLIYESMAWWAQNYKKNFENSFILIYQHLSQEAGMLSKKPRFLESDKSTTPMEAMENYASLDEEETCGQVQYEKVENLKRKLSRLVEVKEDLRKILSSNQEAEICVEKISKDVDTIMKSMTQIYNREILPEANKLVDEKVVESEQYVHSVVVEGDLFEQISMIYLNYKKQMIKFNQFSKQTLDVLRTHDEQNALEQRTSEVLPQIDEERETSRFETSKIITLHNIVTDLNDKDIIPKNEEHSQSEKSLDQKNENETISCTNLERIYSEVESERSSHINDKVISDLLTTQRERPNVDNKETCSKVELLTHSTDMIAEKEEPEPESEPEPILSGLQKDLLNQTSETIHKLESFSPASMTRSKTNTLDEQQIIERLLLREIMTLKEERELLHRENYILREQVRESKENCAVEETSKALQDLRATLFEAQDEVERVYQDLYVTKEENKALRKKCYDNEKEAKHYQENSQLKGKVEALTIELYEIKRGITEKNNAVLEQENHELLLKIKKLEEENIILFRDLEASHKEQKVMQSRISVLEAQQVNSLSDSEPEKFSARSAKSLSIQNNIIDFKSKDYESNQTILANVSQLDMQDINDCKAVQAGILNLSLLFIYETQYQ